MRWRDHAALVGWIVAALLIIVVVLLFFEMLSIGVRLERIERWLLDPLFRAPFVR